DAPPELAAAPSGSPSLLTLQGARERLLTAERFEPTMYLYDNQPGGIGLTERLFELLPPLLARARDILAACPCQAGCPSCVGPVTAVGREARPIAAALVDRLLAWRRADEAVAGGWAGGSNLTSTGASR